jgi:hypothetical protein
VWNLNYEVSDKVSSAKNSDRKSFNLHLKRFRVNVSEKCQSYHDSQKITAGYLRICNGNSINLVSNFLLTLHICPDDILQLGIDILKRPYIEKSAGIKSLCLIYLTLFCIISTYCIFSKSNLYNKSVRIPKNAWRPLRYGRIINFRRCSPFIVDFGKKHLCVLAYLLRVQNL